jgi:hypothetical protein
MGDGVRLWRTCRENVLPTWSASSTRGASERVARAPTSSFVRVR